MSAMEKQESDGKLTSKNLDEFKRQTIQIANSIYTTPLERDMIFKKFSEVTGGKAELV